MTVNNFICEDCTNMKICTIFKTLKKFHEDYTKNPHCVDITIDTCPKYLKEKKEK